MKPETILRLFHRRHRTAAQPEREAVLEEAAKQALLQVEKYAEFFCEEDFDPLVDQLRAALTTPAPAVSRDDRQSAIAELCEGLERIDKIIKRNLYRQCEKVEDARLIARALLSKHSPDAPGNAGTRATESGEGDEA